MDVGKIEQLTTNPAGVLADKLNKNSPAVLHQRILALESELTQLREAVREIHGEMLNVATILYTSYGVDSDTIAGVIDSWKDKLATLVPKEEA